MGKCPVSPDESPDTEPPDEISSCKVVAFCGFLEVFRDGVSSLMSDKQRHRETRPTMTDIFAVRTEVIA